MAASSTTPFGAGQSGNNNERNDLTKLEESFLNVLGPSGYEQHPDKKAKFRHSRLHIPDRLPEKYLGKNDFMQERVDGTWRGFLLSVGGLWGWFTLILTCMHIQGSSPTRPTRRLRR